MGTPRKYYFTMEMEDAIKTAMRQKKGSLRVLAETDPRFHGIPYRACMREATRLGYFSHGGDSRSRRREQQDWCPEETEFAIEAYCAGRSLENIATSMRKRGWRRTPLGIRARMELLRVSRRMGDFISLSQLATELGTPVTTVQRWVAKHGLPIHHTLGDQGAWSYISYPALRRWILANSWLFSLSAKTVDIFWLIGVLCPAPAGDTADHETPDDDSGAWLNGEAVRDVAAAD